MKTQDAINHFGSKTKLCEALGLSRAATTGWGYWVPKKHAMTLGHETDLEYDHALYSGDVAVFIGNNVFTAAPEISSFQIFAKEVDKKADLYFYDDEEMTSIYSPLVFSKGQVFKELPLYRKVTPCS